LVLRFCDQALPVAKLLIQTFLGSFAKRYSSGMLCQEKKNKHTQTVSFTVAVSPLFSLMQKAQRKKLGKKEMP
jgi:hypothetical protein